MKNDEGMALVTVLITIVITMLLLTTLTLSILSTGKQTQRSQENVQADSLALMGEEYILSSFEKTIREAESVANRDKSGLDSYLEDWKREIKERVQEIGVGRYELTLDGPYVEEGEKQSFAYTSKGIVEGQEETLSGTLTFEAQATEESWQERIIRKREELVNSFTPSDKLEVCDGRRGNDDFASGDYWIFFESCKKGANEDLVFKEESRVWLEGDLEMKGNNSITIHGFTYFDFDRLYMNGGNTITVYGDVYAGVESMSVDMKNNTQISIEGDVYFDNPAHPSVRSLNLCINGRTNAESIPAC